MKKMPTPYRVQNRRHTARDLIEAVRAGEHRVIEEMLDDGIPANAMDDTGKTALMVAAHEGFPITLRTLLDRGARVNAHDRNGDTALHWAVATHELPPDPECLPVLLSAGANLEARNQLMQTPLLMCARAAEEHLDGYGEPEDYLQSLMVLLASGADVDARDNQGACLREILENNPAAFFPDKLAIVIALLDQRNLEAEVIQAPDEAKSISVPRM